MKTINLTELTLSEADVWNAQFYEHSGFYYVESAENSSGYWIMSFDSKTSILNGIYLTHDMDIPAPLDKEEKKNKTHQTQDITKTTKYVTEDTLLKAIAILSNPSCSIELLKN